MYMQDVKERDRVVGMEDEDWLVDDEDWWRTRVGGLGLVEDEDWFVVDKNGCWRTKIGWWRTRIGSSWRVRGPDWAGMAKQSFPWMHRYREDMYRIAGIGWQVSGGYVLEGLCMRDVAYPEE